MMFPGATIKRKVLDDGEGGGWPTLEVRGPNNIAVDLRLTGDRVAQIWLMGSGFATADGIRVGDSLDAVIAIDPAKFNAGGEGSSGTDFAEGMRRYVADIKAPDPDGIKYAGERAQAVSADRTANGIPIAADLEADLRAFAAEAGVEINLVQA